MKPEKIYVSDYSTEWSEKKVYENDVIYYRHDIVTVKAKKKFQPPSQKEWVEFFKQNGYREDAAKRSFLYYEDADPPWTDSTGKQIRSWKSKARAVWFKAENEIKPELEPPNYRAEKKPDWWNDPKPQISVEDMRRIREQKLKKTCIK